MSKFTNDQLNRWKHEISPAPIIGSRIKLRRENAEYIGTCPPCFHDARVGHPDTDPSLKIWKLDDGTWGFKCFSCQACGNVFQFVQAFDKVSFPAAVGTVLTEAGVSGWQDGQEQIDNSMPEPEHKNRVTFPLAQYAPAIEALEKSSEGQTWLMKRGISMDIARKFRVGFVQDATLVVGTNHPWVKLGWVTFPTLSADGETITEVKYRSLVAKKEKTVEGIRCAPNMATTMFNLQSVTPQGDVWIAEGEPDTLVLAQAGLTAVGFPSASYNPTDEECEILSTAKRRFLAGDADAPGLKTMESIQKRLRGLTYVIKWPNNRKDANDVLTNECGNDPGAFKALVTDLMDRATQTETECGGRDACDITPKQIRWLWQDRIPLGKITLLAGNPDNGKSLASTSIAAICTQGDAFPESNGAVLCPPSEVVMLIGEDDPEDTAVPRLMAAGGDLSKVHFIESVRPVGKEHREIRLDFDIPAIERRLTAHPSTRLLIIDPISNYLGDVSMMEEQKVRSILIPLKRVAEKHNIAIVIVMHLNKKNDLDAISRVGGAMAFVGVARCSWLFTRTMAEEATGGENVTPAKTKPDSFSMLRIKNNLVSSSRAGLAYSVAVRPLDIEGETVLIPYVVWGEAICETADDALHAGKQKATGHRAGRPDTKKQVAIKWLEDKLQDGECHPSKRLLNDAEGRGIKEDTLRKAFEEIGGEPVKRGKAWFWKLGPMNETLPPQQTELVSAVGA